MSDKEPKKKNIGWNSSFRSAASDEDRSRRLPRGPRSARKKGEEFGNDRRDGFKKRTEGNDREERGGFNKDRNDREGRGGFRNDRNDRGGRGGFRNDRNDRGGRGGFRNDRNDRGGRGGFRNDRNDRNERFSRPDIRPWVKKFSALKSDKARSNEGLFLMEGVNCVIEAVRRSPEAIKKILVEDSFENEELLAEIQEARFDTDTLTADEMKEVSSTITSQGIIAVCRTAALKPDWTTANVVTLVDAVQDPGNLGAIFRTALGFGADAIVMGSGTVDPFNPKVVRGSSGTFLRMPFETRVDLAERIHFLKSKGFSIISTSPHAKIKLEDSKFRRKVAILVGNEGAGANTRYMDMADECVSIPMASDLESLNVSVAHGIVSHWVHSKLK